MDFQLILVLNVQSTHERACILHQYMMIHHLSRPLFVRIFLDQALRTKRDGASSSVLHDCIILSFWIWRQKLLLKRGCSQKPLHERTIVHMFWDKLCTPPLPFRSPTLLETINLSYLFIVLTNMHGPLPASISEVKKSIPTYWPSIILVSSTFLIAGTNPSSSVSSSTS
jgi:hypothetical protein